MNAIVCIANYPCFTRAIERFFIKSRGRTRPRTPSRKRGKGFKGKLPFYGSILVKRNPLKLTRFDVTSLPRMAARVNVAKLYHEPPRKERRPQFSRGPGTAIAGCSVVRFIQQSWVHSHKLPLNVMKAPCIGLFTRHRQRSVAVLLRPYTDTLSALSLPQ